MVTFLGYFLGLIVVAAVLFFAASFVFGRGEELAPAPMDSTPLELPDDRPVRAADLRAVRLPVVFRGYRMTEIDWLIEETALALEARDQQIATLLAAQEAQRRGPEPRYEPGLRTGAAIGGAGPSVAVAYDDIDLGDDLGLDEPDEAQRYRVEDAAADEPSAESGEADEAGADEAGARTDESDPGQARGEDTGEIAAPDAPEDDGR